MTRFHWPAIGGLLTTVAGILATPEVLNILPKNVAVGVVVAGAVIQAVTKPVAKAESPTP